MTKLMMTLFFAALMCSQSVKATLIANYAITLNVTSVQPHDTCDPDGNGAFTFGCISVGDEFIGSFSVDSSILNVDGNNNSASLFSFWLPFGNAIYSIGTDNITLSGFRNPSLGASAPGFLIESGDIVDFYGGVYGLADVPFIDMFGLAVDEHNHFAAYDGTTSAKGSLLISRIPTPSPIHLLLICAIVFFLSRTMHTKMYRPHQHLCDKRNS